MDFGMELRHLRYFVTVAETLSFTKASLKLRVAQSALCRQVQQLEYEIGINLFKRSPRGVVLTEGGRVFLDDARDLLKRSSESVDKVRALVRGEYGELHVGYSPVPTAEILPPALAAFHKEMPGIQIILHDLADDELVAGLMDGKLHLAVMVERFDDGASGLAFEELGRYRFCVAMAPNHPFARMKSVPLSKVAAEPLIALQRKDYSTYYRILDTIFSPHKLSPRIAVECDSTSSLITEVQVGHGIAVTNEIFHQASGDRLAYRMFSDSKESHAVGIMRSVNGDLTPAGEKFCKALRKVRVVNSNAARNSAGIFDRIHDKVRSSIQST